METVKALNANDIYIIATGVIVGTLGRIYTLKVDIRQIPTYPSAYFNNIIIAFIASALGAIAIPAIMARDFVAITFLTVAVQQFREVRTAERESLGKLEHTEYVKRGEAYIDGISKTFESRNYLSLITALITVFVIKLVNQPSMIFNIACGIIAGVITIYLCSIFIKGKIISHICNVYLGKIEIRGSELYVDDIFITNYLGTERGRNLFEKEGLAVVLTPKYPSNRITLENYGQRQAIFFEAVRSLGVKRYKFMKRHFPTGKVIIALVPIINDPDQLIKAVSNTPILENSRKVNRIMKTTMRG